MVLNKYCNLVIFFTFSLNHKIFQKLPVPYVSRTQSPPPFPPRSLESRILNITDNQKCTVCEKLIKFWKWPVFYIFPLYTLWLDLDQRKGTYNEILGWIRIGIKLMQIKNTLGGGGDTDRNQTPRCSHGFPQTNLLTVPSYSANICEWIYDIFNLRSFSS